MFFGETIITYSFAVRFLYRKDQHALETQPKEGDGGRYFEWSFRRKVDASESRRIISKGTADFLRVRALCLSG